jgi:hypothetical protein
LVHIFLGNNPAEFGVLNECLQELLDGIQVEIITFPCKNYNLEYYKYQKEDSL